MTLIRIVQALLVVGPAVLLAQPVMAQPPVSQPLIEEAFSPYQGATELVVRTINEAGQSIQMAAYSFTSRDIAQALVNACDRKVDVRIVFDKSERKNDRLPHFFAGSCVQMRINDRYTIMHDKFIIVDNTTLETGSFNFTEAAEKHNAENVLVIHDAPDVIKHYSKQWEKLWAETQ